MKQALSMPVFVMCLSLVEGERVGGSIFSTVCGTEGGREKRREGWREGGEETGAEGREERKERDSSNIFEFHSLVQGCG